MDLTAILGLLRDPATQSLGSWLIVVVFSLQFSQQRRNFNRLFERQDAADAKLSTLAGAHSTAERLHGCPMIGLDEILEVCPLVVAEEEDKYQRTSRKGPGRRRADRLKEGTITLASAVKREEERQSKPTDGGAP